jgi:hypothetical protein
VLQNPSRLLGTVVEIAVLAGDNAIVGGRKLGCGICARGWTFTAR